MRVDLNKEEQYPISIGQYQPNQLIELNSKLSTAEKFWVIKAIKRKPKGEYRLRVIDLEYGNLILQRGGENELILLDCGGDRGADITVHLSDYTTDFKIIINPTAIKDYNGNLQDISESEAIIQLKFKLELTKEGKSEKNISKEQSIFVKIERPDPQLNFKFDFFQDTVTYNPQIDEPIHIGNLEIRHSMNLICAPELAAKFRLQVESEGNYYPLFISLSEDIEENNPICTRGDVNIQGINPSVLLHQTESQGGNVWHLLQHIRCNNPTNVITLPVILDMTKIANPKNGVQHFNLMLNGGFQGLLFNKNFQREFSSTICYKLYKNQQLNQLQVLCIDDGDREEELNSGGQYDWGKIALSPNLTNELRVRIFNSAMATDTAYPNACILVRNIIQSRLACETNRIILDNNTHHADYFVLKDNNGDPLPRTNLAQETFYRLYPTQTGRGTFVDFTLSIASDDIENIEEGENGSFATPLEIDFEFECAIDLEGNTDWKQLSIEHFRGSIRWKMEQVANPEWLSVDFGTSAIVASFDRDFQPKRNSLLNLKANKQELLRRTYKDQPRRMQDENSEPEPFISSVISFNSQENEGPFDKVRDDKDFKQYSIWLSPSTGMMDIMLPCLKTLIGYKTLPNIFVKEENEKFSYQIGDGQEKLHLFKEKGDADERGLALVNNILKEVYKQLFCHFICLSSDNIRHPNPVQPEQLHKLVLSVPNTFTPKHHALLKDIAKQIFPTLRPEYLQVVSESDAVACYYLARRDSFFKEVDFLSDDRKSELDNKEYVLVFDMGAGTLDLTYFIKQTTPDGLTRIKMQGKLGVNKAGNYLDYLLGEILYDLLLTKPNKNKSVDVEQFKKWLEIDKEQRVINQTGKKECEALKSYLRDTIKPLLNEDKTPIPVYSHGDYSFQFVTTDDEAFTIYDIRTHPLYKAYIQECTEQVLDNLVSLFGEKQEEVVPFGLASSSEPHLTIDVLVFSGRSTALYDIRRAVARYIIDHSSGKEVLCADLTTTKLSSVQSLLEGSSNTNQNSLKTVVTSGSLIYADWINRPKLFQFEGQKVFADYGVLIHKARPDCWDWHPLITNKSPELPARNSLYDIPTLFKGDISIDIENTKEVIFVQSYSKNPAQDWTNENKDMISEMAYHHVPTGTHGNKKLSMSIDANNRMTCFIEGYGKISLEPHDDFQNKSLRKSLWPVVF